MRFIQDRSFGENKAQQVHSCRSVQQKREALVSDPYILSLFLEREGFLGVVDSEYQFLVINQSVVLEINEAQRSPQVGQRPGEIFNCNNYCNHPGVCGTTPSCQRCQLLRVILEATLHRSVQMATVNLNVRGNGKAVTRTTEFKSGEIFNCNNYCNHPGVCGTPSCPLSATEFLKPR
jgi:hypothetical protein